MYLSQTELLRPRQVGAVTGLHVEYQYRMREDGTSTRLTDRLIPSLDHGSDA